MRQSLPFLFSLCLVCHVAAAEDLVIADFEGQDYGGWTTTGESFGQHPSHGTEQNQQPVEGFIGHGLVNSYLGGDGPKGTLTSPPIVISRPYINFLIGGGAHPGTTCINLKVGDKIVRTSTGRNDEFLDWESWDVRSLAGQTAQIEIVDHESGQWGHINIDQIVQSDKPPAATAEAPCITKGCGPSSISLQRKTG